MLNQTSIRIVLVETFHPGNIGAAARAMKTMGLNDLVLVSPQNFPDPEATSRAAGATDLLENARVVSSLQEALSDRTQVFATSARKKHGFDRPQVACETAVEWMKTHPLEKVAIVFGPERTGLSAEDIGLCQQLLFIPGNPDYDVLNMASAVQIVCYEICRQLEPSQQTASSGTNSQTHEKNLAQSKLASHTDLENFYLQLEQMLKQSGYIRDSQPTDTMKKLRRFFNKAEPEASDVSMLRGVIKALSRSAIHNLQKK